MTKRMIMFLLDASNQYEKCIHVRDNVIPGIPGLTPEEKDSLIEGINGYLIELRSQIKSMIEGD